LRRDASAGLDVHQSVGTGVAGDNHAYWGLRADSSHTLAFQIAMVVAKLPHFIDDRLF
jgi:hypothetical protein